MKRSRFLFYSGLLFVCVLTGCLEPSAEGEGKVSNTAKEDVVAKKSQTKHAAVHDQAESFFVVDHYDPKRDAANDLETTTKLAGMSGKRILIEVGGKW